MDGICLIHADCREVLPLLEAGSVDAVVTDPPYGITVKGSANVAPTGTRNSDFFADGDDWAATVRLAADAVDMAVLHKPGTVVVWCGHRQISSLAATLEHNGYATRMLYWRKRCPAPAPPGTGFTNAVETAVYGYRPGRAWNGSQYEHNIFEADSYRFGQPGKVAHPTQKPMRLIEWNVSLLTNDADTILDPFAGSGTTLRVAKDLGRRAIGIEIEERYCTIAAERLSKRSVSMFNEFTQPKLKEKKIKDSEGLF